MARAAENNSSFEGPSPRMGGLVGVGLTSQAACAKSYVFFSAACSNYFSTKLGAWFNLPSPLLDTVYFDGSPNTLCQQKQWEKGNTNILLSAVEIIKIPILWFIAEVWYQTIWRD